MTTDTESAQVADQEVVADEAVEQTTEGSENTDGQVESPPAEDEGEQPESEEVSPSKARRERRKAEMERVRQEKAETEAKLAQAEARLKRLDEAAKGTQPPKESDYQSYDEYQAALYGFHTNRTLDERQRREASDEAKQYQDAISAKENARMQELAQNWHDQITEASTKYADFHQVFNNDLPVTRETAEMLAGSDVGADVAYYLGTHRQEAAQIASLSPLEQARRIGAIEARLLLPKANTTSKAPEPINPVKGKASPVKDPAKMSMAQYRKWRESGGTF